MAEDQDDAQKTEDPTHKRLEDARKKGQIPQSREINHFFVLFAFMIILTVLSPSMMKKGFFSLRAFITSPHDIQADGGNIHQIFAKISGDMLGILALPIGLIMVLALAASISQSKFNFSLESIKPKLEKISPLKGLKKMFSMKSFMEFFKGILKLTIVATVSYLAISPSMDKLRLLPNMTVDAILLMLMGLAGKMLMGVLIIMFIIALADYAYQRFEFIKSMRMTKQEVKDEYKQQEGDPIVKQRLRAIRMERARVQMMANVADSDVVVTNPTHYAVALKYESMTMNAPMVMAMGTDDVAERIKERAKEHKIPILRNPPLARAIYASGKVEEEIPMEHYQAVAEVISYIYKLKGKGIEKT